MQQPRLLETEEDRLEKIQLEVRKADETLARYLLDIATARKELRELRAEIDQIKPQRNNLIESRVTA